MARMRPQVLALLSLCLFSIGEANGAQYMGKLIGKLSELHHGVSGEVYAVDSRTLFIKDFTYDGQGPAAYFYASTSKAADRNGFRLRDEKGSDQVIRRYRKEGVTLTLPDGKTIHNIKIFYVWCVEFEVNFGDVKIPRNFDYPRPQKIDGLKGVHGVSSDNIVIVDAQTLLIPNLSYDGEAPDAKFWVGRGPKPSPQGIRVPDENGKENPLRRYDRKTVVLTLPGDLTVFEIGHFGIWCEAFTVDFGHVQIPSNLNVPPSLRMLGVSPQSKLNCEVLFDDLAFEVRWAVAGESIVLQLVAKLDKGEYMSFGISGEENESAMVGGDVVVAWLDKDTLKGYAEDYYLDAKSQCSGPSGSCPDNRLSANTNSIRLLNAAMVNGYSIVTYQRPLKAADQFDKTIRTNQSQPIIWAVGPLNQRNEVSFHSHYTKGDQFVDFGRPAKWNCPMPETEQPPMREVTPKVVEEEPLPSSTAAPSRSRNSERRRAGNRGQIRAEASIEDTEKSATRTRQQTRNRGRGSTTPRPVPTPAPVSKRNAWTIPPIQCYEPEDGVFYAQMGPTGGKRGYPAITGHVGWGISWYINGLLIPEINVVRGKTYTFVVEGGFDPEVPAKYHPFYITDDPVGGFEYKTPEEKNAVKIFAGVNKDLQPIGTGRLCHWTHQGDSDADDFESFGAYQRTLELKCDQGEPGVIQWTPDADTPDTVYYQCFTHRYLGWKINVLDTCDEHQTAASELQPTIVEAPKEDLEVSPSVRIETRVKANNLVNVGDNMDIKSANFHTSVSEKKINPKLDPIQIDGQPKDRPFLIQQPQQYYFNPIYGHNFNHNPYAFENPFNHEHTFRPSTPLNQSETTTLTYSSTTITPTTTEKPSTTIRPLRVVKPAASEHRLVIDRPKFINRKPLMPIYRPKMPFPVKSAMRRPPNRQYPHMIYKKPIFYPPTRPQVYIKHPINKLPPSLTTKVPITKSTELIHVEISPQQASTEHEPDFPTTKSPITHPTTNSLKSFTSFPKLINLRPALNTGFKPESVVIEGGFKPIITKDFEDRVDNESDVEYESEIGVINVDNSPTKSFEPIFVPSPADKTVLKRPQLKKHNFKFVIKQRARSIDEDTAASDRVESFYLPPQDVQPMQNVQQRSNIDFEENLNPGPDVVVTYDGKRVSGASLTARIVDRPTVFEGRASKAAELIKARPQFVPYKGELPPLTGQFLNTAPQAAVLSRNLGAPLPSTKLERVKRHTTKQENPQKSATNSINLPLFCSILVVALLLRYL